MKSGTFFVFSSFVVAYQPFHMEKSFGLLKWLLRRSLAGV